MIAYGIKIANQNLLTSNYVYLTNLSEEAKLNSVERVYYFSILISSALYMCFAMSLYLSRIFQIEQISWFSQKIN